MSKAKRLDDIITLFSTFSMQIDNKEKNLVYFLSFYMPEGTIIMLERLFLSILVVYFTINPRYYTVLRAGSLYLFCFISHDKSAALLSSFIYQPV